MATGRTSACSVAGGRSAVPHIRVPVDSRDSSFTLIELIAVIAVLGVLLGVGLGFADSARQRARRARACCELAAFAQALDAFRAQYGDYPRTGAFVPKGAAVVPGDPVAAVDAEAALFNALLGKLGPSAQPLCDRSGGSVLGRAFVDVSRHTLEFSDRLPSPGAAAANAFLDPWGRRYQYFYRNPAAPADWRAAGFVLFSVGPDGEAKPGDPGPTGAVDAVDPRNADNLHAGKE